MKERMSWKDDERLYQPRIAGQRIRELHQIAELSGQPMTVLLDMALRRFVEEMGTPLPRPSSAKNPIFEPKESPGEWSEEGIKPDFEE